MTIPSFITSIGESAFEKCSSSNQVSLQIPSSIKSNGDYTFNGCSSFKRFRIPSSLSSIGESDFKKGSSMTQITIPFSLISIKKKFYAYSSFKYVTLEINSSVNSSINDIFSELSLFLEVTNTSSVAIKEFSLLSQIAFVYYSSLTRIGNSSIEGLQSLTEITIVKYAFSGTNDNSFFLWVLQIKRNRDYSK
ncbi:hypothetical protein M9Y10_018161 [Tritrichomonas musculus]|uniref:Surface antigen BspA-like n=1 Tax=Tritrichomonas musculus TaxID=1915356 RepID=A0ABR2HND9_9EUKA